jgi:tetratricopeptide (TPR) repeat protein
MRSLRGLAATLIVTCLTALGACGCGANQSKSVSADYGTFGQPPSDEECQQFGLDLQQAIAAHNVAQADRQINYDAIFEHSMADIEISEKSRAEVKTAVMNSLGQNNSLAAKVCSVLPSGVTYRFLRVRSKDGQKCALFRLMGEREGLNYHEFVLVKQPDGQVRAVDVYLATSGEFLSETYHKGFVCAAAAESPAALARLSPGEAEFARHSSEVREMGGLIQQNKFEQALDLYARLPEALRAIKSMQLMRIKAASSLNDRRYDEAIGDFCKVYPSDPCLDLMLVDSYRIHNQTAMALKVIDRIDQSFGPDSYLSVLRARFYMKDGRYDEALKAARKATQEEPDLDQGYWIQVEVLLAQRNCDEATRVLRVLKDERKKSIARARELAGYSELVKSPAFIAWTKQRRPADAARDSNASPSEHKELNEPQGGNSLVRPGQTPVPPTASPPKHDFRWFRSGIEPEKSEMLPAKLELAKATEGDFTITSLDLIQEVGAGIGGWSPDGDRLLLSDKDNSLAEISLKDWTICRRLSAEPGRSIVAWSDKSLLLGTFTSTGTWIATDLASDTLTGRLTFQFTRVAKACGSLQPPRLFFADSRGETISIFDLDLRNTVLTASRAKLAEDRGLAVDHPASGPKSFAVTPDGKLLLYLDRNRLESYAVDGNRLTLKQSVPRPAALKTIVTGIEANGFAAFAEQRVGETLRHDWQFYRMTDLEHHVAVVDAESGSAVPALVPKSGDILTMNTEGFAVRNPQGKVKQFLPWTLMAKTIRAGGTKPGFTTASAVVARIYAHPQSKGALIVTQQWGLWIEWKAEDGAM